MFPSEAQIMQLELISILSEPPLLELHSRL